MFPRTANRCTAYGVDTLFKSVVKLQDRSNLAMRSISKDACRDKIDTSQILTIHLVTKSIMHPPIKDAERVL